MDYQELRSQVSGNNPQSVSYEDIVSGIMSAIDWVIKLTVEYKNWIAAIAGAYVAIEIFQALTSIIAVATGDMTKFSSAIANSLA